MTRLSHEAQAIWDAFNEDEAGVFVDYGDKLAAAFRAAADQVVPPCSALSESGTKQILIRLDLLAIASELEGHQ
jgi:hypothetical protein